MEYTVVTAENHENLIRDVNRKIGEGWEPLGGVAFMNVPQARPQPCYILGQAMIRKN